MPRRFTYALAGGLLAPGAPIGLLGLRLASRRGGPKLRRLTGAPESERATYWYIGVSTAIAFTFFGYVMGRRADRLAELSETDALTGLRNARGMFTRLETELARAARNHEPLALLLIDLDNLKSINDRHGHRAGDESIRSLARVIESQLRATDIGARWGGDEFAVVAPNTPAEPAMAIGERIRALIATDVPWNVTGSVGIAVVEPAADEEPADVAGIMRSADSALYEAKRQGKNRIVLHAAPLKPAGGTQQSAPAPDNGIGHDFR
jgi:diguanylate cyclase (GGDEF)-like protein